MAKLSDYLTQNNREPLLKRSIVDEENPESLAGMRAVVAMRDPSWKSYIAQTLASFMLKADEEFLGVEGLVFTCHDNAITLEATDRDGRQHSIGEALVAEFESDFIETDNPLFQDVLRTNKIIIHDTGLSMMFDEFNGITKGTMIRYLRQTLPGYRFGRPVVLNGEMIPRPAFGPKPVGEIVVNGPDHRGATTFSVIPDPDADSITISKRGIPLLQAPRAGGMGGILEITETAEHDPFMPTSIDMISGICEALDPLHPCKLMDFSVKAYSAEDVDGNKIAASSFLLHETPLETLRALSSDQIASLVEKERSGEEYRFYPFHISSGKPIEGIALQDGRLRISKSTLDLIDRWRDAIDRAGSVVGASNVEIGLFSGEKPATLKDVSADACNNPYDVIAYIGSEASNWSDQRLDAFAAQTIASMTSGERDRLDVMTSIIAEMSHDTTINIIRSTLRQSIKEDYVILDTHSSQNTKDGLALIDFIWPEVTIARDIPLLDAVLTESIEPVPEDDATSLSQGFTTEGIDDFMMSGFGDFEGDEQTSSAEQSHISDDVSAQETPDPLEAEEDVSRATTLSAPLTATIHTDETEPDGRSGNIDSEAACVMSEEESKRQGNQDVIRDSVISETPESDNAGGEITNEAGSVDGFTTEGINDLSDLFADFDDVPDVQDRIEPPVIVDTQVVARAAHIAKEGVALSRNPEALHPEILHQNEDFIPVTVGRGP